MVGRGRNQPGGGGKDGKAGGKRGNGGGIEHCGAEQMGNRAC